MKWNSAKEDLNAAGIIQVHTLQIDMKTLRYKDYDQTEEKEQELLF